MQPTPEQIIQLKEELELLAKQQSELQGRINNLSDALRKFEIADVEKKSSFTVQQEVPPIAAEGKTPPIQQPAMPRPVSQAPAPPTYKPVYTPPRPSIAERLKENLAGDYEKFIGENLISKIGIVILVIGVGIGTKYAIDKDLLSPLTRIILGYLLGGGVLAFGIKSRLKYENFSAILVSGAMAIFYLITFAAFSYYQLIPQAVAFGMMVIFTTFTVMASLYYNRQWIGLLAMVGGYGIPFLLSNETGRIEILFGYMLLLNTGLLVVAVKKYWRVLYFSAFALSWTIMLTWLIDEYDELKHFKLALTFSTLFFLLFYAVFLVNKLVEKKKFEVLDIIFLLLNSFIYFGIGFDLINENPSLERFAGLFTLLNALIHFVVALVIYRMKLADRNLFYLVSGLVLVFITLAIPVQLDGGWVTLTWAAEAALLFWIGRSQKVSFYEWLSYPLMFIALISQIHDWSGLSLPGYAYYVEKTTTPILNIAFLISILVCSAFGFITYISTKLVTGEENKKELFRDKLKYFFGSIFPPSALLILLFFTFREELIHFWEIRYAFISPDDTNYYTYYSKAPSQLVLNVWVLNYAIVFISLMGLVNIRWIKSKILENTFLIVGLLALISFILNGLPMLGMLRDHALHPDKTIPGITFTTAITLRYISIISAGVLLFTKFIVVRPAYHSNQRLAIAFDILLHVTLINIISHELITWLKINEYPEFDKLGLSICWGVYSLLLIGLGIFQKKKHLRIAAIVLFGITLLKLFFYDLTHLTTIAKTIVFIILGMLLLTISFLYNKYKNTITGSNET